jgi:hypothetical protein
VVMNMQLKRDGSCRQFQNRLTRHAFQSGRIAGINVYSLKDPATEDGICLFPVAVSFFQLLKCVNMVSVLWFSVFRIFLSSSSVWLWRAASACSLLQLLLKIVNVLPKDGYNFCLMILCFSKLFVEFYKFAMEAASICSISPSRSCSFFSRSLI